jgi:epoxyqueuosine reductase
MESGPQARIREIVESTGLSLVGIAPARPVDGVREAALGAREAGRLADMAWMTDAWIERAADPQAFLPGGRSLIVAGLPCHAPDPRTGDDGAARGRVARYARGRDYHRVFEGKLRRVARAIGAEFGAAARATVDYGPLLERPLAAAAGLGWIGKSTMLLVPGTGPWVLLGIVATTLELSPQTPLKKTCGSCTRCIAACPTGAIASDGHSVDARLCISYHTIENRGVIPRELRAKFKDWVFGCDDCLDSCPVGSARWETYPEFAPASVDDARPVLSQLLALDAERFVERYRGRAIMRAKRDGLVRNACIALGNVGTAGDLPALAGALADPAALVRGHAAWAWGRIGARTCVAGWKDLLERRLAVEQDPWVHEEIRLALAEAPPGG